MRMHLNKRSTGEPYLVSSSQIRKQTLGMTLSRPSSSTILKTGSGTSNTTGSSAMAMVIPEHIPPVRKSKRKGKSSCHTEIVKGDDVINSTLTETIVRENYSHQDRDYLIRETDQNQNIIEPFDEAISQEIAIAVALIVAEYEMMKAKEKMCKKHHASSTNASTTDSKEVVGETIVSTSTISSLAQAVSHSNFEQSALIRHEESTTTTVTKTVKASKTHSLLKTPPTPSRGVKLGGNVEVRRYLTRVQNFMNSLGYHREGEPDIRINVRLSMKMQMITAKELIRAAMPIKCLHAVVLAVYLTNCIETLERFPIYFRSHVGSKEYKHIVLGIYVQGHFGSLGISRDDTLQDKNAEYVKLSDLIFEFVKSYSESGHTLNEVKFGQIITHDPNSLERLFSKIGAIPICGSSHEEIEANVERYSKQLRGKMGLACLRSHQSPAPIARVSRSRTSMNNSNSGMSDSTVVSSTTTRARALSVGPIVSLSRRTSDDRLGRSVIRSKPPKSMRN